jgi:hypothetical protein
MLPPFSGAAISQSAVVNNQVQLGDVFSTQTLNVDSVSDTTSVVTTAMGNGATAAVDSGSLSVQSTQTMSGATGAQGSLNVATYAGGQVTMIATGTANTFEADSLGGGGLTGTITQVANGATVTSENDFTGSAASGDPAVQIAAVSASSQAIANAATINAEGGTAVVSVNQSSASTVDGESGSAPPTGGATVQYSPGEISFTSIAINNNVTATGTSGASQELTITQASTGANTTAGQFLDAGNVQTAVGEAVATSNNISASNASGDLNVTDNQTNATYTQADSVVSAYEYGTGQSTAQGVGNAMMAANVGPSTEVSNTQNNSAGIQVMSSFTGGNTDGASYDSVSSASAIGNSATGFACTDCGGVLTVSNSQTNSGGVGATSTVTLTGSNRSTSSVATAVGNNATFYVSK